MRCRTRYLTFVLLAALPACRETPPPVAPSTMEVPPAGEYTLQISEAQSGSIVVFVCLTISGAGTPIAPGASSTFSVRVLMEPAGDDAVARLPSASGANGGDLRLTFMRTVRGTVSGTITGRATGSDGRSGFDIGHGTLTGTATDDWRRASGQIKSANMSFTVGGTSCSSSEATWQLSRP